MRLSARSLLALFLLGWGCGLIGDHAHVASATTRYLDTGGFPSVWGSPIFFPPMVGLATAAIAELRLHLGEVRREGRWEDGLVAVAGVLAIYLLTALFPDESTSAVTALVAALAGLLFARLGGGGPAAICGAIAALVGPLVEILESEAGVFEYTSNVDGLLGVAPWLVPLYFAFGVASARLGELFAQRDDRRRRHTASPSP